MLLKWACKVLHQSKLRLVETYFRRFPGITWWSRQFLVWYNSHFICFWIIHYHTICSRDMCSIIVCITKHPFSWWFRSMFWRRSQAMFFCVWEFLFGRNFACNQRLREENLVAMKFVAGPEFCYNCIILSKQMKHLANKGYL